MKIASKSRYALEAVVYMQAKSPNEPMTIKNVAKGTGISERFLEQIFYRLRGAGLLATRRGPGGGFLLALPPEEITAADLLRAMEEELVPVQCVRNKEICHSATRDACATRALWVAVSERIEETMAPLTVARLAQRCREEGLT